MNTVYRGKVYWFWGDTNRPAYPLGNFNVPARPRGFRATVGPILGRGSTSTTSLATMASPRVEAQMPGSGPTWIDGLVVVHDESGQERLFAG